MDKDLVRAYVVEVINEDLYYKGLPKYAEKKKKKRGVIDRALSFITGKGSADEIFEEWAEDQELYGVDLDEYPDIRDQIKKFVRDNYEKAETRAKGDKYKLERILRRGIDNKFRKFLSQMKASSEILEDI